MTILVLQPQQDEPQTRLRLSAPSGRARPLQAPDSKLRVIRRRTRAVKRRAALRGGRGTVKGRDDRGVRASSHFRRALGVTVFLEASFGDAATRAVAGLEGGNGFRFAGARVASATFAGGPRWRPPGASGGRAARGSRPRRARRRRLGREPGGYPGRGQRPLPSPVSLAHAHRGPGDRRGDVAGRGARHRRRPGAALGDARRSGTLLPRRGGDTLAAGDVRSRAGARARASLDGQGGPLQGEPAKRRDAPRSLRSGGAGGGGGHGAREGRPGGTSGARASRSIGRAPSPCLRRPAIVGADGAREQKRDHGRLCSPSARRIIASRARSRTASGRTPHSLVDDALPLRSCRSRREVALTPGSIFFRARKHSRPRRAA